jgi:hypothetical protein
MSTGSAAAIRDAARLDEIAHERVHHPPHDLVDEASPGERPDSARSRARARAKERDGVELPDDEQPRPQPSSTS